MEKSEDLRGHCEGIRRPVARALFSLNLTLPDSPHSEAPKALAHISTMVVLTLLGLLIAINLYGFVTADHSRCYWKYVGGAPIDSGFNRHCLAEKKKVDGEYQPQPQHLGADTLCSLSPASKNRQSLPILVFRTPNGRRLGLPRPVRLARRSPASRRVADRIASMRPLAADTSSSSVSRRRRIAYCIPTALLDVQIANPTPRPPP